MPSPEVIQQYSKKGSLLLVEGRLQTRDWQDDKGVKHWRTEIIAERLQLGPRLGKKAETVQEIEVLAPVDPEPALVS